MVCCSVVRLALIMRVQMEMRLAVAILVGRMRFRLDPAKMTAATPEDLMAGTEEKVTICFKGGLHMLMAPRCPGGATAAA